MLASPKKEKCPIGFPVGHFIMGIAFGKKSKEIDIKPDYLGFLYEAILLFFQEEDKENQSQHGNSCANAIAHGAG
jgi:hypothetical protein